MVSNATGLSGHGRIEEELQQYHEQTAMNASIIGFNHQPDEPMIWANHGATDQPAQERMWRYAQHQTEGDEKPRIPMHPNISEAPNIESQAALRRGVEAE